MQKIGPLLGDIGSSPSLQCSCARMCEYSFQEVICSDEHQVATQISMQASQILRPPPHLLPTHTAAQSTHANTLAAQDLFCDALQAYKICKLTNFMVVALLRFSGMMTQRLHHISTLPESPFWVHPPISNVLCATAEIFYFIGDGTAPVVFIIRQIWTANLCPYGAGLLERSILPGVSS